MKRLFHILWLLTWLFTLLLPLALPASAEPARQRATPTPTPPPTPSAGSPEDIKALMSKMTVADKVGQLFLVTFMGSNTADNSDIATLVRDYRVGGVVLLPENDNFRNTAVNGPEGTGQPRQLNTPQQIVRMANRLQALGMSAAQPVSLTLAITLTQGITPTATVEPTPSATPVSDSQRRTAPQRPTPTPAAGLVGGGTANLNIPLLVGLDWTGDGASTFGGSNGFTPLPSNMGMGATWAPDQAARVGQVLGSEIKAAGVNLLLGPSLDVLDAPRPGSGGDLRTSAFGGDPFWVGQMGRAFISGVQEGTSSSVLTASKHFPGQGAADRRPEDEVATVQKSLQQLRQIELAPFTAVAGSDLNAPGVTGALMTSHIRYRGFQGNIRQLTPPISLAPQLGDLMAQREFADWRAAGGILMSDALGVPAIRRYYDPGLQKFPHRQVAQDAFLAGNDLLYLSRFALTDNWPDQFQAIRETVVFFQSKYQDDAEFRARLDASVERILKMKRRIYKGNWSEGSVLRDAGTLDARVGRSLSVTNGVARAATTLIYPGREELADRLPSSPLADENILIFTDAREGRECGTCPVTQNMAPSALQDIMLRLYGPTATGQVLPSHIRSLTFADLDRLLAAPPGQERDLENAISLAQWIVFAQLDFDVEHHPASAALRTFLAKRSDSLRDKRLVVIAFDAPYYLDTTEISKLTAYFGLYAHSAPFLETAVRALFREFTPGGSPPVSVSGINYDLISQLEPAPGQVIGLGPLGPDAATSGIQVGSRFQLQTGVILDRNAHPVPDGTPVEFHLRYPVEGLQLAPLITTTLAGRARAAVSLDRVGELWITIQAGPAKDSARIVLKVGGDTPGSIATVLPSPTVPPSPTPTATPTRTPTPEPSATPEPAAAPPPPPPPRPRVALPAFLYGLVGVLLSSGSAFAMSGRRGHGTRADPQEQQQISTEAMAAALWASVTAWLAYLLYSFGWLPGATELQAAGSTWAAAPVTLLGGFVSLLWSGGASQRPRRRGLSR